MQVGLSWRDDALAFVPPTVKRVRTIPEKFMNHADECVVNIEFVGRTILSDGFLTDKIVRPTHKVKIDRALACHATVDRQDVGGNRLAACATEQPTAKPLVVFSAEDLAAGNECDYSPQSQT